jgi:hypothetical protein
MPGGTITGGKQSARFIVSSVFRSNGLRVGIGERIMFWRSKREIACLQLPSLRKSPLFEFSPDLPDMDKHLICERGDPVTQVVLDLPEP